MRATKTEIIQSIQATRLVPLFHHHNVDSARHAADAAYKAGARVFEFANRGPNTLEIFKQLVKHCEGFNNFYLGVGTMMDAIMTQQFIDEGAHFSVSPIFKHEIADVTNKENILWIPGCATLSEIVTASDAGAEIIKVFPGSVLGPGFISAVMPVVPRLRLMPTGGVEPNMQNLSGWFKAKAFCVGMGSQLFPIEMIEEKDWDGISNKISSVLKMIANC